MPITLTDVSADTDALAVDYNANLQKMRDKFSTSAGVGIGDADIATDAAISGSKLSTVNQVPTLALATDAVDNRVLRKDPSVSANRPVTADHVRDGVIQKKHIDTAFPLTNAQLALKERTVAFSVSGTVALNHLAVQRLTNGGNFRFLVTNHIGATTSSVACVPSPDDIAAASNRIVGVHIADVTPGVTTTGTLVITYIPLT